MGLSAASWAQIIADQATALIRLISSSPPRFLPVPQSTPAATPKSISYLLSGRNFAYFSVGAAALADGVHYFILAPNDAIEHNAQMSPALASWIQGHGQRLDSFPARSIRRCSSGMCQLVLTIP